MSLLSTTTAVGLSIVGDDLIVVEASLRAGQARWSSAKAARFFAEGAEPTGAVKAAPKGAPVTLVWPTHRLLRRDAVLGEQTLEQLREAVREAPDAFFPVGREDALLWDAHEYVDGEGVRRASLFALRLNDAEGVLSRLAQAGLTPTRLVPAGAAWSVLRFVHDEAPEAALEIDAKGWSLSTYDGLAWTGVRTGFGAAPAELRDRARREGWAVCDWRVSPGVVGESATWRPDDLHAEHAALGAALLDLARVDARGVAAPSEIDLLGTPARRSLRVGALGWFAAACAVVVVGLLVWSDAARARAEREVAALTAEVAEVRPAVERVEALRAQAEAIVKAHDRLSGLERTYRPMSLTLSELATALPRDSHLARVEFADTGVTADVVTSSRTQLMRAIESSPMFQGVALTTGSVSRATGEEQFGLGFNFEAPAPGAEEGR